ncbi:MAG: thioredoxin fold domain-containing protein [Bacteroidetes bacterium]|nr:thioredoxin fold domain-containing protein [Bacteroidota bacterium]
MQKVTRIFILLFISVSFLSFITVNKEKINWISVAQLNEMYYSNPKPIVIDVYTDWCGWCKKMDKTTYEDNKLVAYVNEHYYAVRFNAESQEELQFNKKTYSYNAARRSNALADYLLFGQLEFPTTVFLPTIDAQPAPLAGYMKAKEMEAPLKYFGDGEYKNQTFTEYNKKMKGKW